MELVYFFAALAVIAFGILVYSLIAMSKEKHSQKA